MRRNLLFSENIMSESTNSSLYGTTLPAGDYHVHSEGGKLCVADDRWRVLAFIRTPNTEAEFHLDKQMALNIQEQDKTTCRNVAIESKPAYDIFVFGGGASKLLHRADRAVLSPSRRVTADETGESMRCDRACRQWFRGADGRIDLYRHDGRSAAFASMGQYTRRPAEDRHVFRDTHGHVIRRHRDQERDYRGWLGHHARNEWMVMGRHIARQGCARDHTVPRMVQRRGLAGHASFGRRLLRQGFSPVLAPLPQEGVV